MIFAVVIMTDTEAMRESFEWTALNELKWNKRDLERNRAGEYEHEDARAMWLTFQAGHAAALADHFPGVRKMVGVELPEPDI